MARICSVENCNFPVFGTDKNTRKGYCKSHQYLRTDIKKRVSKNKTMNPIKKTPLKKHFKPSGEAIVFNTIFDTRKGVSQLSGIDLSIYSKKGKYAHLYYNCFAHVLPKGTYPELRVFIENIFLVTPHEHHLIDRGTQEERDHYVAEQAANGITVRFELFYERKQELMDKYVNKKI